MGKQPSTSHFPASGNYGNSMTKYIHLVIFSGSLFQIPVWFPQPHVDFVLLMSYIINKEFHEPDTQFMQKKNFYLNSAPITFV